MTSPLLQAIDKAEALHRARDYDQALAMWREIVIMFPDAWQGVYGMGCVYAEQGIDFAAAMIMLMRAVDMSNHAAPPLHMLGTVLRQLQHVEAARECYRQALETVPNDPLILTGLAGTFVNMGEPKTGIEWARKALASEGGHQPHVRNSLALMLLEDGQWEEGWKHYRRRSDIDGYHKRDFGKVERWNGKRIRNLAIHAEQGLGDEIMFASVLPEIIPLCQNIAVEVNHRLVSLFQRSFPTIKFYASCEELLANFKPDAWDRLADVFGSRRPTPESCPGTPFLKADPARIAAYRARLQATGPGPYIGLAWLGGTPQTHERVRRAPRTYWKEVIESLPGTAVSLQYGDNGRLTAKDLGLHHWQLAIDDMEEFAALISALDCVISSPQTAIHFGGALGVETHCLMSTKPAWRYGQSGPSMPLYKSVEMHRQVGDDWAPVFDQIKQRFQIARAAE